MKTISEILKIRRNQYHIDDLSKARTIVPFVGAGMSSGIYPMWYDFLKQFPLLSNERDKLHQLLDSGKFEDAASYIFSISERIFIDTVKDVFSPSHLKGQNFSDSLKILPKIADDMVITTNLDEVLETVWKHQGKDFEEIIMPDYEDQFNQAIISDSQILVKLHGTVKESSKYVLTKEQYDNCYGIDSKNNVDFSKPFPRDLGRAMQSKTIIFLGCSLKNDRVLHILKQIAGWNEYVRHYAILALSDNEEKNIHRERELAKYGIFPIWFPDNDYDYIEVILNELLRLKKKHRKIDYFPNTLPRDFSGLQGRDRELDLTVNVITKRETTLNTVIISSFDGMPAVGKTTLAVRLAHMLSMRYQDAQLFIDCYGYTSGHEPLIKEQILDSLLFALGIPITRIPEKYVDKLSLWRLELHNKSVIIVFDNVKYESQVDELIPSSTNSLFIITSRNRLLINDCCPVTVDVLDSDASVLILNGGKPEKDKIRYGLLTCLAEKYGNLPLALQIISHQIKGKSNKYIQRLINNKNRLRNLGAFNDALYLSFDISYEKLQHSEQFLFQVLGLFPGFDFSASSCAAMVGVDTERVYTGLDILFQEKLIKEVGDERYVLHDLMRDFSRAKYYEYNENNHQPLIRLLKYYIEYIIHCNNILYPYNYRENIISGYTLIIDDLPLNKSDALNWLRIELENILSILDIAKQHKWYILYFKLSYVLSQYIMKSLPGWRAVRIYQDIINFEGLDMWMRAATKTNLALAYSHAGRFDIAVSTFVGAEKAWDKLNNWKALIYTLGNHAFTLERLGNYTDALNIIQKALKYTKAENDLSGMASILNSKGAVYWRLHQYQKARMVFEEAIEIRRQFGDEYGASNSINNLAFTLLRMGDEQSARKGFAESLKLSREFQDYSGEAVTLNNLGYTEIFSNQPNKAIEYAQDAFNIATQIGNEYQVARSYDVKGNAYLELFDEESALISFKTALEIFDKLNVPEADEVRSILDKLNR